MHAPLTFTERMELGKEIAVQRRNRGVPTGQHASWDNLRPRVAEDPSTSWQAFAADQRRQWRDKLSDVRAAYDWDTRGRFGYCAWGVETDDIPF